MLQGSAVALCFVELALLTDTVTTVFAALKPPMLKVEL